MAKKEIKVQAIAGKPNEFKVSVPKKDMAKGGMYDAIKMAEKKLKTKLIDTVPNEVKMTKAKKPKDVGHEQVIEERPEPKPTVTITRRFEFDAAHRVLGHGGKCQHLHGHRYAAEVQLRTEQLNELGMVIDFGLVKVIIGQWIDSELDHNTILNANDPIAEVMLANKLKIIPGDDSDPKYYKQGKAFSDKSPYLMKDNPTAENLAVELLNMIQAELQESDFPGIQVVSVRLYETPNCWADAVAPSQGGGGGDEESEDEEGEAEAGDEDTDEGGGADEGEEDDADDDSDDEEESEDEEEVEPEPIVEQPKKGAVKIRTPRI
jgi:6-pyruvoyltetrahydropterin/6-carboxytetrahydropterin synthase